MTKETECTLCPGKRCVEVKDKKGITRVIMSTSYPTDMSIPETSKIPISGCVFKQAQEPPSETDIKVDTNLLGS
jgi:deoxycytidylate deaminase